MSRRPDIIRWVIDWMLANEQCIKEELALRCEREARAEWGGQRVDYVAKHCAADKPARTGPPAKALPEAAVQDYVAGRQLSEISVAYGVSRASLYRGLKRK